eukprot:2802600-Pleurochrysis_carterae.AAC.4
MITATPSFSGISGDEIAKIDHIFTLDVLDGDNAILDALVGAMSDGARADRVRPSSDGLAAETTFTGAAKGSADEMREPRRGASILSKSEVVICACDMFYDQDVIRATMRSFARVAKRQLVEAGSRHGSSNSDERELRGEASAKLILARSSNFEHNDQCLIGTFPELGLRLAWQRDEIVPAYMLEDLSIGPLLDDTVPKGLWTRSDRYMPCVSYVAKCMMLAACAGIDRISAALGYIRIACISVIRLWFKLDLSFRWFHHGGAHSAYSVTQKRMREVTLLIKARGSPTRRCLVLSLPVFRFSWLSCPITECHI